MHRNVVMGLGAMGGIAIAVFFGAQAFVSGVAAKEIDQAIEAVSPFVDIDYKKIKTSFLSKSVSVEDVVVTPVDSGQQINIDELVLYQYDADNDIPSYLNMAAHGVSMKVSDLGEHAAMFSKLGYKDDLLVDFATEYEYEKGDQAIRVKHFKVGADKVGDVELSLHLANVSLDSATLARMPFSLVGMEFYEATLTYQDDSLVKRMWETTAAAEGTNIKAVKAGAIANLTQAPGIGELLTEEQLKEVEKFINNPKAFSISMSPHAPVSLGRLMTVGDGQAITQLLNVNIEAN